MTRPGHSFKIVDLVCIFLGAILFWQLTGIIASSVSLRTLSTLDSIVAAACGAIFSLSIIELAHHAKTVSHRKDDSHDQARH